MGWPVRNANTLVGGIALLCGKDPLRNPFLKQREIEDFSLGDFNLLDARLNVDSLLRGANRQASPIVATWFQSDVYRAAALARRQWAKPDELRQSYRGRSGILQRGRKGRTSHLDEGHAWHQRLTIDTMIHQEKFITGKRRDELLIPQRGDIPMHQRMQRLALCPNPHRLRTPIPLACKGIDRQSCPLRRSFRVERGPIDRRSLNPGLCAMVMFSL